MSAHIAYNALTRTGGHIGPPLQILVLQRLMAELFVDVVCVGADLRVRPHSIQRSDENGWTHRSAPTKGYSFRSNL